MRDSMNNSIQTVNKNLIDITEVNAINAINAGTPEGAYNNKLVQLFKNNSENTQERIVSSSATQNNQKVQLKQSAVDYTEVIQLLLNSNITQENFEEILCLKNLTVIEMPAADEEAFKNFRYKDKEGNTVAIVQISMITNKIKFQAFAPIMPWQGFLPPNQVNYKILMNAKMNNWEIEDGGINQFDGNIETRYKDADGKVMAAIISKPNGEVDTIVEYQYENDLKSMMEHTSQFGHSKIIYDVSNLSTKLTIDIDTDGNICGITTKLN